jgi:hypothetical protein
MHRDTHSVAVANPKMEDNLKTILAISPPGAEKKKKKERLLSGIRQWRGRRHRFQVPSVSRHVPANGVSLSYHDSVCWQAHSRVVIDLYAFSAGRGWKGDFGWLGFCPDEEGLCAED